MTHDEATVERVAQEIRAEWVRYCLETGNTKPSHIAPWEELDDWNQEADRRIARAALDALGSGLEEVLGEEWTVTDLYLVAGRWRAFVEHNLANGVSGKAWGDCIDAAIRAAVDAAREASRDTTALGEASRDTE